MNPPHQTTGIFCSLYWAHCRCVRSGIPGAGTEWGSFTEELKEVMSRGPVGCTADEAGLGLALNWVQHALITAYENNCPMRLVKPANTSLRWTATLESLRKNVKRLFNKS
jgi:hypothetical protein